MTIILYTIALCIVLLATGLGGVYGMCVLGYSDKARRASDRKVFVVALGGFLGLVAIIGAESVAFMAIGQALGL